MKANQLSLNQLQQVEMWLKLIASTFAFILAVSAVFAAMGSDAVVSRVGPQHGLRLVLFSLFMAAVLSLIPMIYAAGGKSVSAVK